MTPRSRSKVAGSRSVWSQMGRTSPPTAWRCRPTMDRPGQDRRHAGCAGRACPAKRGHCHRDRVAGSARQQGPARPATGCTSRTPRPRDPDTAADALTLADPDPRTPTPTPRRAPPLSDTHAAPHSSQRPPTVGKPHAGHAGPVHRGARAATRIRPRPSEVWSRPSRAAWDTVAVRRGRRQGRHRREAARRRQPARSRHGAGDPRTARRSIRSTRVPAGRRRHVPVDPGWAPCRPRSSSIRCRTR